MKAEHFKKASLVIVKLAIAFLAFYWVFRKIDSTELLLYVRQADISFLLVAYMLSHLSLSVSALRSRYYFSTFNLYITKQFSWALYYVGTFFNVLLPGGISGDGYKVYLLWKLEKFAKLKSLRIVFYERVNGVFILGCFSLMLFPLSNFVDFIPYGTHLSLLAIALALPAYLLASHFIIKDKAKTALGATRYSLVIQATLLLSAASILHALRPEMPLAQYSDYLFLFTIASVVAILPISIGGAGLRELTFLYGLELLPNADIELGVALAILNFAVYVLTALVGLPFSYKIKKIQCLEN